jgi:hypothetical protein
MEKLPAAPGAKSSRNERKLLVWVQRCVWGNESLMVAAARLMAQKPRIKLLLLLVVMGMLKVVPRVTSTKFGTPKGVV